MPTVLVYSDDPALRDAVRLAVGRVPSPEVGEISWLEATTGPEVLTVIDAGEADLLILDGEAQPEGGFGLARQVRHEVANCPPVLLLMARKADRWLANWSQAQGAITTPLDPAVTAAEVVRLLTLAAQREPAAPHTGRFGRPAKVRP